MRFALVGVSASFAVAPPAVLDAATGARVGRCAAGTGPLRLTA